MPQAHFTVFLTGVGYHESAWRLADPADLTEAAWFPVLERAALAAERGLLDAVFFADSPGLAPFRARYFPQVGFDPLELLAALSRLTSRIGLIATASTTYSAPYDLARRLSTIDHLSGGRVAQAGSSGPGINLAGRTADLVFTAQPDVASGARFRASVRAAAQRHGRSGDDVLVLPGVAFVLGSTEAEALAARAALEDRVDPEFRWRNLAHNAGLDATLIDPDKPLSEEVIAEALAGPRHTSRTDDVARRTRETGKTFGQLAEELTGLPGGLEFTGTPEQFADLIERWLTEGAGDGFTLQPATLPGALELFVDHVVPILQKRGLHRGEYSASTLRGHLGAGDRLRSEASRLVRGRDAPTFPRPVPGNRLADFE